MFKYIIPLPWLMSGVSLMGMDDIGGTDVEEQVYEVTAPSTSLNLYPFYKKYISAKGYPIVSSDKVSDYALYEATYLVNMMLAKRNDVRQAMVESGSRLIVMSYKEMTTDVPEHRHLDPQYIGTEGHGDWVDR